MKHKTTKIVAFFAVLSAGVFPVSADSGSSRVEPDSTYYAPGMVPIGQLSAKKAELSHGNPVDPLAAYSGQKAIHRDKTAKSTRVDSRLEMNFSGVWLRIRTVASVIAGEPEILVRVSGRYE